MLTFWKELIIMVTFDAEQGRKSMFKHGGDNIGEKYTSRLRDVLRGAKRRAFLGGFGGMRPREFFLNGAIWCILVYIWIRFCPKKISKITIFYIIFFLNYHFFNKKFKNYYFLYKK